MENFIIKSWRKIWIHIYGKNYLEEDKIRQNDFSYSFYLLGKQEESQKGDKKVRWRLEEPGNLSPSLAIVGDSKEP